MGDKAAPEGTVGNTVFVENREIRFKDLVGIADSAVDARRLYLFPFCRSGHYPSPEGCFLVAGCVPDHKMVFAQGVQHLGPEFHFSGDFGVRRALDRECESRHRAVFAQRMYPVRKRLVQQAEFTEHIVDGSQIQLFIAHEQLLLRDGQRIRTDSFTGFDELFKLHHPDFFLILIDLLHGIYFPFVNGIDIPPSMGISAPVM